MANPVEYTFWGYWRRIAMKTPKLLFNSYRIWFAIISFALFFITLLNKQIGVFLVEHWKGVSPWWSALSIGILLLSGVTRAIYEDRQELYLTYKGVKNEAEKAKETYKIELDQLKKQLDKNDIYMPLSEAVDELRQEGLKQTQYGYSLDSTLKMLNTDNEYDRLARLLANHLDIHGKQPSSSIGNWVKINDHVNNGFFKKLASEFYLKRYGRFGPDFNDLAIKKDDLNKAIKDILSSYTLYQG